MKVKSGMQFFAESFVDYKQREDSKRFWAYQNTNLLPSRWRLLIVQDLCLYEVV